jgi:hypothetical protein
MPKNRSAKAPAKKKSQSKKKSTKKQPKKKAKKVRLSAKRKRENEIIHLKTVIEDQNKVMQQLMKGGAERQFMIVSKRFSEMRTKLEQEIGEWRARAEAAERGNWHDKLRTKQAETHMDRLRSELERGFPAYRSCSCCANRIEAEGAWRCSGVRPDGQRDCTILNPDANCNFWRKDDKAS